MRSDLLLLYSMRPEDQVFARRLSELTKLALKIIMDVDTCVEMFTGNQVIECIIDASNDEKFAHFEEKLIAKVGPFSPKLSGNHFHLLSHTDLEDSPHLHKSQLFGHFILRTFKTEKEAVRAAEKYQYSIQAASLENAFGLKNFFSAETQIQNIGLQKTSQKQKLVSSVNNYLLKAHYPSRMASMIANAVDELLMNAIFTAPVDPLGKRIYDNTPRDRDMEIEPQYPVQVTIGFDGTRVGISVTDSFGSLSKEDLVRHLAKIYKTENYAVLDSREGAGIGLSTIFRTGGTLIFICEPNVKTEVIVAFERFDHYKAFRSQFRFINLFFYHK